MRYLLVLCLSLASIGRAADLVPFEAEYRLFISKIPMPIKARLALEALPGEDEYRIELQVRSILMKNTETSHFTWHDCAPKTDTYRHEFRGFGARRHHDMVFSWSPPQVHNMDEEGKEDTFEVPEETLDELTLLLKARCAFADGAEEYLAYTAYGDDLREHVLDVVGHEKVDTPVGELDTLVIRKQRPDSSERSTYFWIAPALDYMLVKAKHVENPALFGELILRDISAVPHTPENVASDVADAGDTGPDDAHQDEAESAPAQ